MKKVETELNGNDLKEMGYQEGHQFKEMLNRLKNARLDGEVSTRQQEKAFIEKHFKR